MASFKPTQLPGEREPTIATVADKKVPVSVAGNAILFLFRWCYISANFFHWHYVFGLLFPLRTTKGDQTFKMNLNDAAKQPRNPRVQ